MERKLNSVDVIFEDPSYNYSTSVSGYIDEKQAKEYFVGRMFNVGSYPKETFMVVKDIVFHDNNTVDQIEEVFKKGGRIHSALARDRKYTSSEPHEIAYKPHRKSPERHYMAEGGDVSDDSITKRLIVDNLNYALSLKNITPKKEVAKVIMSVNAEDLSNDIERRILISNMEAALSAKSAKDVDYHLEGSKNLFSDKYEDGGVVEPKDNFDISSKNYEDFPKTNIKNFKVGQRFMYDGYKKDEEENVYKFNIDRFGEIVKINEDGGFDAVMEYRSPSREGKTFNYTFSKEELETPIKGRFAYILNTYDPPKDKKLAKGGHIGFDKVSEEVAEEYEGKPVPPKYQKEYGKTYSKEEAQEVGDKVAAKIAREKGMMANGGTTPSKEDQLRQLKAAGKFLDGDLKKENEKMIADLEQDLGKVEKAVKTTESKAKSEINKMEKKVETKANKVEKKAEPKKKAPAKKENRGAKKGSKQSTYLTKLNAKAKEIRKEGESYIDAKRRAVKILKGDKPSESKTNRSKGSLPKKTTAKKTTRKKTGALPKKAKINRVAQTKRGRGADGKRQALPAGKRISKAGAKNQYGTSEGGKIYYESRSNHADAKSGRPRGKMFKKGGVIEFEQSNLQLVGKGRDVNGNKIVKLKLPIGSAFSIQTNGNLPKTHRLLGEVEKINQLTKDQLLSMETEVSDYLQEFGSPSQKKRLRVYN